MTGGSIVNGQIVTPFRIDGVNANGEIIGISLYEIIKKVFGIINDTMLEKRIYKSAYQYWVDQRLKTVKVPLALIETKSAWEILQDIANAGCCYVYCDRDGAICFERDSFIGELYDPITEENKPVTYVRPKAGGGEETWMPERNEGTIMITPSNAFSYNLPSINKMIINRAVMEYLAFETAEENKEIEVDIKDCEIETEDGISIIEFRASLKNIYIPISNIEVKNDKKIPYEIVKIDTSFDFLMLKTKTNNSLNGVEKIFVTINNGDINEKSKGYIKHEVIRENVNSIRIFGIQEYIHDSNMLIDEKLAIDIAEKIIKKYKDGLSYINSEWKGNAELEPGDMFSSYDMREKQKATSEGCPLECTQYECLSNEIKFDGGYKQTTKARQT